MTREEGQMLIYLSFYIEEVHRNLIKHPLDRTKYWPNQQMIYHLPYVIEEKNSVTHGVIDFKNIVKRFPPLSSDWKFKTIEDETRIRGKESVSGEEFYEEKYGFIMPFFRTPSGIHLLAHTLAHNCLVADIMINRLELWRKLVEAFCHGKEIYDNTNLERILFTNPEHFNYYSDDGVNLYIPYYTNIYEHFFFEIRDNIEAKNDSVAELIPYISDTGIRFFLQESEYIHDRTIVLELLADKTVFGTNIPWTDDSIKIENNIEQISQKYNQLIEEVLFIKKNTSMLPQINDTLQDINDSTNSVSEKLSNPTERLFSFGIECSALSPPIGDDDRYILNGPMQTVLRKWFNYLLDEKQFIKEDLPTSSFLKTRLRRSTSSLGGRESEQLSIQKAVDAVKVPINHPVEE